MLTKEEKLAILSKAIDEGAKIDIKFHDVSKGKAHELVTGFAEEMNAEAHDKRMRGTFWYTTQDEPTLETVKVTAFYEPKLEDGYMVEDITFEEVETK